MSRVPGPAKKKLVKQKSASTHTGDQASEGGAEGEEGEWTLAGVPGSLE